MYLIPEEAVRQIRFCNLRKFYIETGLFITARRHFFNKDKYTLTLHQDYAYAFEIRNRIVRELPSVAFHNLEEMLESLYKEAGVRA